MESNTSQRTEKKVLMSTFNASRDVCFSYDTISMASSCINSLRPRQNGRYNADATFKCIFLNGDVLIPTKISLKFVPKGPINNIPALVQIMAWRRLGDKPLSELMMVSLLTHICVTRPQWVNTSRLSDAVMQICISKLGHHWFSCFVPSHFLNDAGLLSFGTFGANFSKIQIKIQFSYKNMNLKMLSAKWQPFCCDPNVLNHSMVPWS